MGPLFTVYHSMGQMGILCARDEDEAEERFLREVGTSGYGRVQPATESDIEWVRGMGGRIPRDRFAEESS